MKTLLERSLHVVLRFFVKILLSIGQISNKYFIYIIPELWNIFKDYLPKVKVIMKQDLTCDFIAYFFQ